MIENIDVEKLKLNDSNPRQINEHQFNILCNSLKNNPDLFENRPILCNKDMVIFAGNMRYRAACKIGLKEVPVCIMDISEERQREIMMRDNVSNGSWSLDDLANDFEIDELKDLGFEDVQIDSIIGLGLKNDVFDKDEEEGKNKSSIIVKIEIPPKVWIIQKEELLKELEKICNDYGLILQCPD